MAYSIGTAVRVKGVYADGACTIPVTGTVVDVFDFDGTGTLRFVVRIDEATIEAGLADGMMCVPPGGEFPAGSLATV